MRLFAWRRVTRPLLMAVAILQTTTFFDGDPITQKWSIGGFSPKTAALGGALSVLGQEVRPHRFVEPLGPKADVSRSLEFAATATSRVREMRLSLVATSPPQPTTRTARPILSTSDSSSTSPRPLEMEMCVALPTVSDLELTLCANLDHDGHPCCPPEQPETAFDCQQPQLLLSRLRCGF